MPWLSNVTGTWITAQQAVSPDYWMEQMTARVRFRENAAIVSQRGSFLLEVGPGSALATLVRQQPGCRSRPWASSLGAPNRTVDDRLTWLKGAARLWEEGVALHWDALPQQRGARRKIALPTYAFERERHWIDGRIDGRIDGQQIGGQLTGNSGVTHPLPAGELGKREDIASWFYVPSWKRSPLASTSAQSMSGHLSGKLWVVLEDAGGFGSLLARHLEAAGAQVSRLSTTDLSREGLHRFWKEQSLSLSEPAGQPGLQVALVDCWTMRSGAGDPVPGTMAAVAQQAYGDLLLLLQSAQTARVQLTQIDMVLDELLEVTGERIEEPGRAVLEGMARVLPAEFSGVPVRVIDPGNLQSGNPGEAVRALAAEFAAPSSERPVLAIRHGRRWEQTWQPLRLEALQQTVFRMGGTYVITGGLGGISYLLARHLLSRYGAQVALIGRSTLPARQHWEEWLTEHGRADAISLRIDRAKDLERQGGSLLLLTADVADRQAMLDAWQVVEHKFGAVHGVVHAAGLPGGARIAGQTIAGVEEVLRPKVQGTEVLAGIVHEIHGSRPVDFLLFCSSISAVLPVAGAADYAAANAFQDCFAIWCRQQWNLPAVSINFDAWRDVGMAAEMQIPAAMQQVKDQRLETALTPEEGVEVIERILASGEVQVLVSTIDFSGVMQAARAAFTEKVGSDGPDHAAKVEADAPVDGTLAEETGVVIAIWEELLGVPSIQPADNFFALGGHSLLGTMVLARVRERYGVELTIRAIFEAPTPERLAALIRDARVDVDVHEEPMALAGEREEFEF